MFPSTDNPFEKGNVSVLSQPLCSNLCSCMALKYKTLFRSEFLSNRIPYAQYIYAAQLFGTENNNKSPVFQNSARGSLTQFLNTQHRRKYGNRHHL